MKKLIFYNQAHLGDCLYQVHYCNKLVESNDDINIEFYVNISYFNELNNFIKNKDKVKLMDIRSGVPEGAVNTWITRSLNDVGNYFSRIGIHGKRYDLFYVDFFTELSKLIGVESPIKNSKDMLFDNVELLDSNIVGGDIDYLIINSTPLSGQFTGYNLVEFDTLIRKLVDSGNKVVTTKKTNIESVLCTTDYNLSLMDIGNLSIKSKNIIAVMTAPIIPCFNIYSVDNFDNFFVLENTMYYSFNDNIRNYNDIKKIIKEIC